MRLVFLDIDGVLFTKRSARIHADALAAGRAIPCDDDMARAFDPQAVANLLSLVSANGAGIVVSSTWRLRSSPERLATILGFQGIRPIVGATGRQRPTRGREVMEWLQARSDVESFVILDDCADELDVLFPKSFVRCDPAFGFGDPSRLREAMAILSKNEAEQVGKSPPPPLHPTLVVRPAHIASKLVK